MRFSILILLVFSALFAEEPTNPLPPRAQQAEQVYFEALHQAEQAYLQQVERAQVALQRVLEREVSTATRAGNLEGALAIRERLAELEAKAVIKDFLGNLVRQVPARGPLEVKKVDLITTTWYSHLREVYNFKEDGTFSATAPGVWGRGTWRFEENLLFLTWSNQETHTFTYVEESKHYQGLSAPHLRLTRQ